MNKIYKFNYHWLNELSKHKDMLDNDTRILVTYIEVLQQENKQLKSILTELEEWLKEQLMYFCENNEQGGFSTNVEDLEMILDKIQKLKEKYKC